MSKYKKTLSRFTNLPKNRKYGCTNAGDPIVPQGEVRIDKDGTVYADFAPIDPDIQAELDRVLKGVSTPGITD